ncbi:hypothetical protein FGD67_14905 [Colwellia sp. M166]|jgi:hypothetical protein|uniref:hypothetical protein n=1 Tax=Colwellia sp. M166 TaxID=2583805 RepID=UPI00211DD269|nr:hypothetical protein [Colwellia sp. M166]UUO24367.1 hypothetical protein FGD67_14905 [Colwellia sp. M166]|tara:strand:- start:507 stop:1100 length:594 start_codon:yes stop_codon:yes gene_type:complete
MKVTTESLLQAKTLITFGLRPQQVKMLTGVTESRIGGLTKEIIDDGTKIATKGSLSANKILRTKNHFRQFSLWMTIYKAILSSEYDFQRKALKTPWYSNIDSNILIKTQIMFLNILDAEFNIEITETAVIDLAECLNILTEISTKESTYIVTCPDCGVDYVIVESSKQTDNCPFCHERSYEAERNRIELIFDNRMKA